MCHSTVPPPCPPPHLPPVEVGVQEDVTLLLPARYQLRVPQVDRRIRTTQSKLSCHHHLSCRCISQAKERSLCCVPVKEPVGPPTDQFSTFSTFCALVYLDTVVGDVSHRNFRIIIRLNEKNFFFHFLNSTSLV